jgi:hypothetical protein
MNDIFNKKYFHLHFPKITHKISIFIECVGECNGDATNTVILAVIDNI